MQIIDNRQFHFVVGCSTLYARYCVGDYPITNYNQVANRFLTPIIRKVCRT